MDKRYAKEYLNVFGDAVFIEKIRGFRKGRRIYKKSGRWLLRIGVPLDPK